MGAVNCTWISAQAEPGLIGGPPMADKRTNGPVLPLRCFLDIASDCLPGGRRDQEAGDVVPTAQQLANNSDALREVNNYHADGVCFGRQL